MSNLKIDIIYYKTASDFEMEFNLSGCCRMRMFKDKVDTPKGLVNTLARDVSRSKITIIVTELYGEHSGVAILSNAVKLPLVSLNKDEYGVQTTDDIFMPKTAIPLVTKAGIYGGCIIENGPQSIIIVSNIRALRHEIMKTYVHNYVFDVGQMMAYQERMHTGSHNAVAESNITATHEKINSSTPAVDDSAESADISSKSQNNFTIVSPELASDDELGLMDEATALDDIKLGKKKKSHKASNIVLLIIVILLLVGFGILAYYFVYLPLLHEPGVFPDGSGDFITEFLNSIFS